MEGGGEGASFSSIKRMKQFALIVCLLVTLLPFGPTETQWTLILREERQGERLYQSTVEAGDVLELSWIHSIEKTPWIERYRVKEDGTFVLNELVLQSFGAGTPANKGKLIMNDGLITMTNIEEAHEAIRWIHSHTAEYRLKKNGAVILESSELPHHESIEMVLKKR
ncbi:DUF1850 domain-containing protein [Shouchella shacheensis]|uniref:DUF1850 domain-containing protein n=1 Tax=Shouchella shacheensis TaxID=1649580 RepID=UPI00074014D8|nr:DUF1850 domain-containing protein [Shouchella shacheensis]